MKNKKELRSLSIFTIAMLLNLSVGLSLHASDDAKDTIINGRLTKLYQSARQARMQQNQALIDNVHDEGELKVNEIVAALSLQVNDSVANEDDSGVNNETEEQIRKKKLSPEERRAEDMAMLNETFGSDEESKTDSPEAIKPKLDEESKIDSPKVIKPKKIKKAAVVSKERTTWAESARKAYNRVYNGIEDTYLAGYTYTHPHTLATYAGGQVQKDAQARLDEIELNKVIAQEEKDKKQRNMDAFYEERRKRDAYLDRPKTKAEVAIANNRKTIN